ncbi:MAG: hypothetical protein KF912_10405 [Phycisphaeraceae bacterium]|nr:hypothetical protein [Phycisphaeraceae bacterium]MBX3367709.1 hypothetical protein [Phycisphaeraceae bacterium]
MPLFVRAAGSGAALRREHARAEAIVAGVGRLEELRAKLAASQDGSADTSVAPTPSLATRVSSVLSAAGLSQSNLAGLSPESTALRSDAGTALRRRATLTLQLLTLRDLGRFVAEWKAREPAWAVTSIDLAPATNAKPAPGADLPIRVVLVVETLSFENQPHENQTP